MVIGQLNDYTYCAWSAFTHLGLWWKLHNCSLHHFTTSQCILKCALLTFSSISSQLTENFKGTFSTPVWEVRGRRVLGNGPIQKPACRHWFLLAPHWHTWSISCSFELLIWLQKHFRPHARPTRIWWQILLLKATIRRVAKMAQSECWNGVQLSTLCAIPRARQFTKGAVVCEWLASYWS